MECTYLKFSVISELKKHYVDFHGVDDSNPYLLQLFQPDTLDIKCTKCSAVFGSSRMKKNHMFLYHYNHTGGTRRLNELPLNVLRRAQFVYYSVNFDQHKNYYDFFSTDMIDVFLDSVYNSFKPEQSLLHKFQGYFEIINQQREPERTEKKVWLTNVFRFKHFNQFVRGEIKFEIIKSVIANGQTGSSWYFKRFNRINIIVAPLLNELKIITGGTLFYFLTEVSKIC